MIQLIVIVISVALHEFGHAAMGDKLGDPTPRAQGRMTLNPVAHFDPMGFMFICFTLISGFGLGWGRPVQVNPTFFKDYRRGMVMVALAGPAMNLCLACFAMVIAYVLYSSGLVLTHGSQYFLQTMLITNIVLIVFNLLPIPPLDGGNVLEQFIPWHLRRGFDKFKRISPIIFIIVIFTGVTWPLFAFAFSLLYRGMAAAFGLDFVRYFLAG